jgi:hypothetical protein
VVTVPRHTGKLRRNVEQAQLQRRPRPVLPEEILGRDDRPVEPRVLNRMGW